MGFNLKKKKTTPTTHKPQLTEIEKKAIAEIEKQSSQGRLNSGSVNKRFLVNSMLAVTSHNRRINVKVDKKDDEVNDEYDIPTKKQKINQKNK
jgi:hypothetical protein